MARAFQGAALSALAWAVAACSSDPGRERLLEETARLRRDTHALEQALAAADAGTFLGPDDVVVGVSENAVADLFRATLPIEESIPGPLTGSAVTLRVDRVSVVFDGGLGTVSVDGQAWFTNLKSVAAEAHLSGGFADAKIDPLRHVLRAKVSIDTLEARPMPGGLLAKVLRGALLQRLNARGREVITQALPELSVPVKVDQQLQIPPLNADPVHVEGGRLPVAVALTRVFASHGRLWLALRPQLGAWQRDPDKP